MREYIIIFILIIICGCNSSSTEAISSYYSGELISNKIEEIRIFVEETAFTTKGKKSMQIAYEILGYKNELYGMINNESIKELGLKQNEFEDFLKEHGLYGRSDSLAFLQLENYGHGDKKELKYITDLLSISALDGVMMHLRSDYYQFDIVIPRVIPIKSDNKNKFKAIIVTESYMSGLNPIIEVSFMKDSSKYFPLNVDAHSRGQVTIERNDDKKIEFNIRMTSYSNGKRRVIHSKYREN